MSQFADSNRADVRAILEAVWGTTPANGKSRQVRYTSHDIVPTKETQVSNEIRADRMVPDMPETGAGTSGSLSFEFSAGAQDDWMESYLGGTWTRPMTMDEFTGNVSWTANNTIQIAGGDFRDYFTVGRRVKTSGFRFPANNGYRQISALGFSGGNTTITTVETTGVVEGALASGRVSDANDVIILNSTAIAAGVSGFTGVGVFTSAVAARQLQAGQKIFVEHSGAFQTGTVTFAGAATVADTVTISDGDKEIVLVAGTDFAVGVDQTEAAANLAAAINLARTQGKINVDATSSAGVTTVRNLRLTGGSMSETGSSMVVANFSGGAPAVRGVFTITTATNDAIAVTPTPPTVGAGAVVTIKGSMLRNPGDPSEIVSRSWTLETHFTDVAKQFAKDGLRVGGLSFSFSAGEIVTGSVSFEGREHKRVNTRRLALAPYTALATTTGEVMNATSNVGEVTKNGAPLATAVQMIEINGEGGLRPQRAVSSKYPRGIGLGRLAISGSLTAYFQDYTLYDHFKAHDTVSLGWNVVDIDGNRYDFTLPAVKIASDNVNPGGIDQDVMEEMEWTAIRDPLTNCMLQIDRFSSVSPV